MEHPAPIARYLDLMKARGRCRAALIAGLVLAACGCGERRAAVAVPGDPELARRCVASVEGVGEVDVESDYLPHVISCENGSAGFEALAAQAVAARSYLYYRLGRTGAIADGTRDQVYSCGRAPGPIHYQAVSATAYQVMRYQGVQVAGFFVAGSRQDAPTCRAGRDDPTSTEPYVTYNEGRTGDAVAQTTLGRIDGDNRANRGCKSQNGAACLSDAGWSYDRILRFYYGTDIELVTATGACVPAPERPTRPGAGCTSTDKRMVLLALFTAIAVAIVARFARVTRRRRRRR